MTSGLRQELITQRPLVHELLRDHAGGLLGEVYRRLFDEGGERNSVSTADVAAELGHRFSGGVDQTLRLCELLRGERDLPQGPSIAKKWRGLIRTLMSAPASLDPGLQRILTELTTALAQTEVQVDDVAADDVSNRVIEALKAASSGVDREAIARAADLSPDVTYHVLKGLRETGIVVSKGQPLIYKLAGDPATDEAAGWRSGIGSQGRRTDPAELSGAVLELIVAAPGITLVDLEEADELVDYSSGRIYGAVRQLESRDRVRHEGRPHRYFTVSDGADVVETAEMPDVATEAEPDGIPDDELSARRQAVKDWYEREKWRHEVLLGNAENWLRDLLEQDTRSRKKTHQDFIPFDQAVIDSRLKTLPSFVQKAARQCGAGGKVCRKCRVAHDRTPHFYYQGDTANDVCRQIEDFVGLRLMVPSHQDQSAAVDLLAAEGLKAEETEVGADEEYPTYRAWHVVLTLPDARDGLESNRVEVQIRTVLQDAAARIEHALLYKDGQTARRQLETHEKRHLRTIFGQMEMAEAVFNDLLGR